MVKVFINYRTDDEHWAAALINDVLSERFGTKNVFLDSKSIPPGEDFERYLLPAVRASTALVAVIGPRWLATDGASGRRRIDDPGDWVRRELAEAFRRGITVLPVLLSAAQLDPGGLPPEIAELARCQFIRMDQRNHHNDLARLTDELARKVLPPVAGDTTGPTDSGHVAPAPDQPWQGGVEVRLGEDCFLLHEQIEEHTSDDHTWIRRQAAAELLALTPEPVFLRQVRMLRRSESWQRQRTALLAEASLMKALASVPGMPRLRDVVSDLDQVALVVHRVKGPTLRAVYGPAEWPLDHFRTVDFLLTTRKLCTVLHAMHRRGHSHRALSPDAVVLEERGARVSLKDLGNAIPELAPAEGRSAYRAPEQFHPLRGTASSPPRTDVYQLAAIVYHVLTSHPPSGTIPPPVGLTNSRLPDTLDRLLSRALDPDPCRRPRDAGTFGTELDTVIKQLRGGGRA